MVADEDMVLFEFVMKTRCRFVIFTLSLVGLLVICLVLLFRSPPSTLISVSPSKHHHKVSVILCAPHASSRQVLTTYDSLKKVLSKIKLEYEFFVVSLHLRPSSRLASVLDPFHVLSYSHSCAESAYYAMEHSHYSVVLYLSSNLSSYDSTIPKLVKPVLQGDSDLVLLEDSSRLSPSVWERFLYLLLVPITGSTRVSGTPSFAISSSVWFHGCHGINGGRGSLTVNLVSRCVLRDWQEVYGKLTPPIEDTHLQLSQVASLWWESHPVVCVIVGVSVILFIIIIIRVKISQNSNNGNCKDINRFIVI